MPKQLRKRTKRVTRTLSPRILGRPENQANNENSKSCSIAGLRDNIKDFQTKQEETEKELERVSIELENRQQIIGDLIDQENITTRMRLKRSISETMVKKKLQNMEDIITNHKRTNSIDVTQNQNVTLSPHLEVPRSPLYLRLEEEEDPTLPIVPLLPITEKKKTRTPKQTSKQKAEERKQETLRKQEERRQRIRGKKSGEVCSVA